MKLLTIKSFRFSPDKFMRKSILFASALIFSTFLFLTVSQGIAFFRDITASDASFWQDHKWLILTIAGLLVTQLFLIVALLMQRRRRARAESELKSTLSKAEKGDRMLSLLMENIPEGITICDANLGLIRVSGYGLDILGGSHEGKSVEEAISQWKVFRSDGITPLPENELPLVRAVRSGEIVRDMELVQADLSGKKIPLLCNATPIRDENGEITGGIVAWRDITEIKQAESAIRESEEKYRNLFENLTEEVHFWKLVRDKQGRIVTWRLIDANPPTLKSWGRNTIDEIRGKTTDEIFGPGSTDHYYHIVEKIISEGTPHYFEDYFPNLDKYFRFTSVPLGEYFITTGSDITSSKKAEQELKSSLNEKEVLLKEIHHRVKNNMQVISSLVSLQARQTRDADVVEILKDVSHRIHSMAMIHEKLYQSKDLSRIDFAQYTESLLHFILRSYGERASGIHVIKELEPVLLPVDKAVPLGLILNELISNVLKHAFPEDNDREVTVTLSKGDNMKIILRVRDNGKGLPDNFNWRDTESLGLRLVQMLSSQLHADVEVSNYGGCEFKVIIGEVK